MTSMNSELYDALVEIGVSGEKARKAAESMNSSEPRFDALDLKIDRLDAKVDLLGASLNAKIDRTEANLINRFEPRFVKLEGEMTLIKWMLGVLVAGEAALILKTFWH